MTLQLPSQLAIARELPPRGSSLLESQRYTRRLARRHYENFHLASWLLPRRLHPHVYNVYAYCRWADDLGDEISDPDQALQLLQWWEAELRDCYAGRATHPVFIALGATIRQFEIPIDPFLNLLAAFRQDQRVHRYRNWDELIGYCRNSADPVGRLMLYLCGYHDVARQRLSDATCTALQLANFWQDVSLDLKKDRVYIPLDALAAHQLSEADLLQRRFDGRYAALMKDLIARTRRLFAEGFPLAQRVAPALRVDIELFSRGGLAVLDSIEAIGCDTLTRRPALTPTIRMALLSRALSGRLLAALHPGKRCAASLADPNA